MFRTSNLYSFILGFAMFGAIVFLPVYLQVVQGYSPTKSGLAFLPMVVGIFSTSISSGIAMSRTGRYKMFPIAGAVTVIVALILLSTTRRRTRRTGRPAFSSSCSARDWASACRSS